jgi:hypothetical protein
MVHSFDFLASILAVAQATGNQPWTLSDLKDVAMIAVACVAMAGICVAANVGLRWVSTLERRLAGSERRDRAARLARLKTALYRLEESFQLLRDLYSWGMYDLHFFSSVHSASDLMTIIECPTKDKNLIIIAAVQNVLHFRIFDTDGKMVVETDENRLPDKTQQIARLKLWRENGFLERAIRSKSDPSDEYSRTNLDLLVATVTSIVGYIPWSDCDEGQWNQLIETQWSEVRKAKARLDKEALEAGPRCGIWSVNYGLKSINNYYWKCWRKRCAASGNRATELAGIALVDDIDFKRALSESRNYLSRC